MEQEQHPRLVWMRDQFGRWFASTTSFTFMWLAVGLAVVVAYFWDAIWSGRQAPEGLELSFQGGGFVVRTWTVFALVGVVALFRASANWLASILLVTWLCTSAMSYGHVLGFVASGQMERYSKGTAVEQVADIKTASPSEKIVLLEGQIASIEDRLKRQTDPLTAEIDKLQNDGILNDDLADEAKLRRAELEDQANTRIQAIEEQVFAIKSKGVAAAIEVQADKVDAVKFDPLYIWIASAVYGENPTDDQLRTVAARVGAFWAFLIEMIAGAGPAILYAAHAHFSDRSEAKDPKRVEAGKKAAKTKQRRKRVGDKIALQAESYLPGFRKAMGYAKNTTYTVDGIASNAFKSTAGDMEHRLDIMLKAGLINQDEIDIIMRRAAPPERNENHIDVINPDNLPATINGTDAPQEMESEDDSSIQPSGVSGN